MHVVRRNLNMVYIVMNNGCYGLTKGQDSATADEGSASKKGDANPFSAIDLCATALQLGATFVARSFSGDKAQLVPLIKAAISHRGFALIDVISPCVTFNNNDGSTKSYDFVRDHSEATDPGTVATTEGLMYSINTRDAVTKVLIGDGETAVVPMREEITAQYQPGTSTEVTMHDGSVLRLHKLDEELDPFDKISATNALERYRARGQVLTGLIYMHRTAPDLHEVLDTVHRPLNTLAENELCPGSRVLENINASLR